MKQKITPFIITIIITLIIAILAFPINAQAQSGRDVYVIPINLINDTSI